MNTVPRRSPWRVAPLLVAAAGLLVLGILGGLQRFGWLSQYPLSGAVARHGPILVMGFFGTLISLERAVAMGRPWMFLVPLLHAAAGWSLVVSGGVTPWSRGLTVLAGVSFLALAVAMWRHDRQFHTRVMATGIVTWTVASVLWALQVSMETVVLWWQAFFVLTIAGERLELGRLTGAAQRFGRWFALAVGVYLLGLLASSLHPGGRILVALGMVGTALWLLRFDVAWVGLRRPGLPRFIALSLLTGYVWLLVAAGIDLLPLGRGGYDAQLHSIFMGFVFSMVFGHAPIIFPALLGLPLSFHPLLYLPLALLHATVALRVAGGFLNVFSWRALGGLGNGLALLLYALIMVGLRVRETLSRP